MEQKFILSCESTVDLPYRDVAARNLPVIFYSYVVDGISYPDDMGRDPAALPNFYHFLEMGKLPTTSQINELQYEEFFEELLQQGDLLHISLGSGLTPSVNNAVKAAENLRAKYPKRKIVVIDSLCGSSGYGLLVDEAADRRDSGSSLEEVVHWVLANRLKLHHQFFSTELKYFRRSGRVSGSAALLGTVLGICPIMRLDDKGRIIAYDKVRGKKKAVDTTVKTMLAHAQGGENYNGRCYICHSNCIEEAEALKVAIKKQFPKIRGEIRICDIGTIISSHSGPGTVAAFFFGDDRT